MWGGTAERARRCWPHRGGQPLCTHDSTSSPWPISRCGSRSENARKKKKKKKKIETHDSAYELEDMREEPWGLGLNNTFAPETTSWINNSIRDPPMMEQKMSAELNAVFNILELALDACLYWHLWSITVASRLIIFVHGASLTYAVNCGHILLAVAISDSTRYLLYVTFYFELFQFSAATTLVIGGILLLACKLSKVDGALGLGCGFVHTLHYGYVMYNNHIR
ncbi:uncharacterized protein LOC135389596 [Ornithodoros turicata]|uniref:uncharacterized protein LOC135389596 n=1 Tax=Ornithodoros turicata TaxID=34597 RepID=UPI003139835A